MQAMFSGRFLSRRLAMLAVLSVLVSTAMRASAAPWDIDRLMQSLAAVRSDRAAFTETKNISLLDRPVESSGELLYEAPDRLEKKTLQPTRETMILEGDVLRIERGRQKHTLRLKEYPQFMGFVDSIRGTLAGDRKALERSYQLTLDGDAKRWVLTLKPTDEKVRTTIHLIRIAGSGDRLRTIDITQTDGDTSVMTVSRAGAR